MLSVIFISCALLCALLWGLCSFALYALEYTEQYGLRRGLGIAVWNILRPVIWLALAGGALYFAVRIFRNGVSVTWEQAYEYMIYGILAAVAVWCVWPLIRRVFRKTGNGR